MLPSRLQQIKDRLDKKNKSSDLCQEEFELLGELVFLEENEEIQLQITLIPEEVEQFEMIAPAPDKCPACGRKF